MEKRVADLLEVIGLTRNTFQVFEDLESKDFTVFFPNFMTKTELKPYISEEDLIDALQNMMEEHAMDIAKCIKMIKRYKKSFGK